MAAAKATSNFVTVTGHADKLKAFKVTPGGLQPFFDKLFVPASQQQAMDDLVQNAAMIRVTIQQVEGRLFETPTE